MQAIPLQALPNQQVIVRLDDQVTQVNVYQKAQGLFMDVLVNNSPIIVGVICENLNRIVRDAYLGFIGDLAWVDTRGSSDPDYTGIGGRFSLVYFSEAELP